MSAKNKFRKQTLNEIVTGIREQRVDEGVVGQAASRVWARVAQSQAPVPLVRSEGASQAAAHQIRGCGDFQALMPAYLAHTLPEARRLLLQDHLVGCVACRHALEAARSGERPAKATPLRIPESTWSSKQWRMAWALAAVLLIGLAIGLLGPERLFNRGQVEAVLQSAAGRVDEISDRSTAVISTGQRITGNPEIRTARDSSAVIRLVDGTSVEMNQRADLWLSRGWRGTTIHLDRGNIIVHAADQGRGRLDVATRDCLVSVKGTIFAVDAGVKGSRVSVIRGQVQVTQGRKVQLLSPGQQLSTAASLTSVPVTQEVAWSRNSGEYLALLSEFSALRQQLEAIPGPAPRYDSALLRLVPEDTVFYAAIPNIGSTLSQASQIFQDRLQESPVLQQWWKEQQSSGAAQRTQELIDRIRAFSAYLGNEVVIAMPAKSQSPLLLAQVQRGDFQSFLQSQLNEMNGEKGTDAMLVTNPMAIPADSNGHMLIYLKNNVMVAAAQASQLQQAAALINTGGTTGFATTPFAQAIQKAYQGGAGWLICADVEQILSTSVLSIREPQGPRYEPLKDPNLGLVDMRYLVVESKDVGGLTQNTATLTFNEARRGMASWLAEPSPLGTLDFVSPAASLAVSFAVKQPRDIVQDVINLGQASDPNFADGLTDFEANSGVDIRDDLAASIGGEVTFAVDGPLLPTPSWKLAVEVNDPARLESAIEKLVAGFNQQSGNHVGQAVLSHETEGGRTYYDLQITPAKTASSAENSTPVNIYYVFVDGYLLAAPSQALLVSSIQNREAGYTLARSAQFASRLPVDGYDNASGVIYQNLWSAVAGIANVLEASSALTPAQRQALEAISQNTKPSLTCLYGEPDRIVVAGTGNIFGMGIESLFGMRGAGPFELLPIIEQAGKQRPQA